MLPTIVFSALIASMFVNEAQLFLLQKKGGMYAIEERVEKLTDPKKRPFCNAFTGCGRKRSNIPALTNNGEELDDSISTLLELNAEPAVENLSRQIMSEAKLWEAIQEANVELNRRRQETKGNVNGATQAKSPAPCVLPSCYI
ncbi:hypothetical protein WA026_010123 [Henosepilachna vigintioctopunctata]|uniref:Cardioactive peptide n=1 Tax=Henosepilachna vigintioctopunctata TaxID=420089 RepID=A0AAW1UJE5_9CUCU